MIDSIPHGARFLYSSGHG